MYSLEEVIIKFGLRDDSGTEHAINGKKYAIEVQYKFNTTDSDDIAKICVLLYSNATGIYIPPAPLIAIQEVNTSYTVSPFDISLDKEIPPDNALYAYYKAADSDCPCTPNVSWFVLLQQLPVAPETVRFTSFSAISVKSVL